MEHEIHHNGNIPLKCHCVLGFYTHPEFCERYHCHWHWHCFVTSVPPFQSRQGASPPPLLIELFSGPGRMKYHHRLPTTCAEYCCHSHHELTCHTDDRESPPSQNGSPLLFYVTRKYMQQHFRSSFCSYC